MVLLIYFHIGDTITLEVIKMSKKVFRCSKCNAIIDARKPNCKFCGEKQSYESRAAFLERQLVDIKCPKCGCGKSFYTTCSALDMTDCCECGAETSCTYKVPLPPPIRIVRCPYCNSIDVKKISKTSKLAHGITFGVFAASKLVNQWHCNNCKSDF